MTKKKYTTHALIVLTTLILTACRSENTVPSADQALTEQTEKSMQEANRQVGMPAIVNFQERKFMKMILELRDQENLVCFAYIVNLEGELIFLGKCIGYGLPYSVQYTNPERMDHLDGGQYGARAPYTIAQPDPNGLYMPEGLSATWLMLIDDKTGDPRPVYVEPEIMVSPFALHGR